MTEQKQKRVVWNAQEIDSITDAGIAKYGLEGWSTDAIRRFDALQKDVMPPHRQRWLKSSEALVKLLPVLELKIKKRELEASWVVVDALTKQHEPPLTPLPVIDDGGSYDGGPYNGLADSSIEELPPLEEEHGDDKLREAIVEKVSDFFADILSLTVRKFLTNADIARTLQHLAQFGRPDVVVETTTQKHIHHDPQPVPKPDIPTILICGFKPHQWPPFQQHNIAKKARLRFWHSDHGLRTLQSKLKNLDAAFFLMEGAGHEQTGLARKAGVRTFAISGGYEPAFRAIEKFLESRKEEKEPAS